jgi:hypothetical protein
VHFVRRRGEKLGRDLTALPSNSDVRVRRTASE